MSSLSTILCLFNFPCLVTFAYFIWFLLFAARCYASAACAVMRCLSVRPSVCLSRSWTFQYEKNISSNFFTVGYSHHSSFSIPNVMTIFRRGPQRGVECRCDRQTSRLSTNNWLSIDNCCSANSNCDRPPCSVPHTPPRISESLFITTSMDDHSEENRTEQNLIAPLQQ